MATFVFFDHSMPESCTESAFYSFFLPKKVWVRQKSGSEFFFVLCFMKWCTWVCLRWLFIFLLCINHHLGIIFHFFPVSSANPSITQVELSTRGFGRCTQVSSRQGPRWAEGPDVRLNSGCLSQWCMNFWILSRLLRSGKVSWKLQTHHFFGQTSKRFNSPPGGSRGDDEAAQPGQGQHDEVPRHGDVFEIFRGHVEQVIQT